MQKRRSIRRKMEYISFILVSLLFLSCFDFKFISIFSPHSKSFPNSIQNITLNKNKKYEFENMNVIEGPAVLVSDDGKYLCFWSWGTVQLDLSNEPIIGDTILLRCRLREDYANSEHAFFKIKFPCRYGFSEIIQAVNSSEFNIFEIECLNVIPGIWEFSFINDYPETNIFPKGRNLFADYAEFNWDSTKTISVRTDTLYYSDLRLPKSIKAVWNKSESDDVDHYIVFYDSSLFFSTKQAYDSVMTADTFAIFNTPWLELYACVIAVDTANNRSGFSEMVRGLILQEPRHKGDWDGDNKIDFDDLIRFCSPGIYGSLQTDLNYDNIFDFDNSGKIDFFDLISFCLIYGTIFDNEILKIN